MDRRGRVLNLGEMIILQREVQPFVIELRRHDILGRLLKRLEY